MVSAVLTILTPGIIMVENLLPDGDEESDAGL